MRKVRIRWGDFMVHMDTQGNTVYFKVYPVQQWRDLGTGKKGIDYIDKETDPSPRSEYEEGKCLKKLEGSYCWRGVWEGRLYFPDEGYWGEDIEELSRLYNDKIIPWCENVIKT